MGKHSIKFRESGQDIEIIFEFVVDNKKKKDKNRLRSIGSDQVLRQYGPNRIVLLVRFGIVTFFADQRNNCTCLCVL